MSMANPIEEQVALMLKGNERKVKRRERGREREKQKQTERQRER
jgi:hypothetical protein